MNTPTPIKNYIAEGRAKQQAAEKEREAYAAEEMTLRERMARALELVNELPLPECEIKEICKLLGAN